ncbi:LytTR family DNA-binding domain-containing protein [Spirosoma sp. 209]|uniref:LytR/AlgR family response regulator transcription factor n=1 Tax=Spirosoma sp. 209 TaxID=1955701 RepID=UPI00098D615B|nr:LytTR family DNA-binding domain-containing protein [Spirosoma sp. 209]
MNVLIIEDEPLAARQLRTMIQDFDTAISVLAVLDSVVGATQWFQTHPQPDLLLADIELVDGQSFEIFDQVEVRCPVIFTTAYDAFALRAFQVHSVDYLLKPIDETALRRSLDKFRDMQRLFGAARASTDLRELIASLRPEPTAQPDYRDRFLLKQGSRLLPVDVTEMAYFSTRERLTFVHTWDQRALLMDYTLDELESRLNPNLFFRANRQFILHAQVIQRVHIHFNGRLKLDLKLPVDEAIFISRDKAGEFRAWLGE